MSPADNEEVYPIFDEREKWQKISDFDWHWPTALRYAAALDQSPSEVASVIGCHTQQVIGASERFAIPLRKGNRKVESWPDTLSDAEKLHMSPTELARELGVTTVAVLSAEKKFGVRLPRQKKGHQHHPLYKYDWRRILQEASEKKMSPTTAASHFGVSIKSVLNAEKRLGISLPRIIPGTRSKGEWQSIITDAVSDGMSFTETARYYGINKSTLRDAERRVGITIPRSKISASSRGDP